MNTKILAGLAAATMAGVLATAGTASAATLTQTFTATSGNFKVTDFKLPLSVQQFNPSLGTLHKVTVDFEGAVQGNGGFENRSGSASTITVSLTGLLSLTQDNLTPKPLLQLTPTQAQAYDVTAFDGTRDFGGNSGRTFSGLIGSATGSKVFTDLASLNVFTGQGLLNFLLDADAKSVVTGSGNISTEIDTLAQGTIKVVYEYKRVPEPSVVIGMGLVAGLGLVSNRKKQLLKWAKS